MLNNKHSLPLHSDATIDFGNMYLVPKDLFGNFKTFSLICVFNDNPILTSNCNNHIKTSKTIQYVLSYCLFFHLPIFNNPPTVFTPFTRQLARWSHV